MVGVVVRLKLRLLRNSLRGPQLAAMMFGGVGGLVVAALTVRLAGFPFEDPEVSVDVLAAVYGAWLVGWVLAPIVTGGGDNTVRAEHFALLPIGRGKLALGLLVAGLVAVTSFVTLVAFAGLAVYGARFGVGPALLGAGFAVLELALVVLVYRLVVAVFSRVLSSRRGKEIGIVLLALLGFAGVGVNYVLNTLGPALVDGRASEFAGVMRALPTGWAPVAVQTAAEGDWLVPVLLLLALAGLVAVVLLVWGVVLYRQNTVAAFHGSPRDRTDKGVRRRSILPASPVGAVAGKEVRFWWRDARRRMALLTSIIVGIVVVFSQSFADTSVGATAVLPFMSVFMVAFAAVQAGNMYGLDGSALWHTIVTPQTYRVDVRGRQLGWALVVGPVGVLLAIVLPAVTGAFFAYPWVLSVVPALLGAGSGMVVLQSVFAPYPLPDWKQSSVFSSGGRPGCSQALLMTGLMLVLAASVLPAAGVGLTGILVDSTVVLWLAVPVGVVTGAGLAWWWGRIAVHRLSAQAPELLAVVSKHP